MVVSLRKTHRALRYVDLAVFTEGGKMVQ
jgi:hypothetical protein